jgi:anti-sigma B factor antagonist
MALKIKVREIGQIALLDLEGSLRLGASEEVFREQIQRLMNGGTVQVAINLSRVTDIDSSGIGLFVRTLFDFKQAGGACVFYSAMERVRSVFKMVRLEKILELAEDEAAALSRF